MLVYTKGVCEEKDGLNISYCVTITEKLWEDIQEMSFAGMTLCNDGIVAFGDSRASRITEIGNLFPDSKRGEIDKVFIHSNFVLSYVGDNEFHKIGKIVYLENYLNENLKECLNWQELLVKMHDAIFKDNRNHKKRIHFLIGERNTDAIGYQDKYSIRRISLDLNGIEISPRQFKTENMVSYTLTIGNPYYTSKTSEFNIVSTQTSRAKEDIYNIMNKLISQADSLNEYNPVGLPVKIQIFK